MVPVTPYSTHVISLVWRKPDSFHSGLWGVPGSYKAYLFGDPYQTFPIQVLERVVCLGLRLSVD